MSIDFYNCTRSEFQAFISNWGKEKFRAQQIFKWVYEKQVEDFSQMSNLSKNFRLELADQVYFSKLRLLKHQISQEDGTQKFLFSVDQNKSQNKELNGIQSSELLSSPSQESVESVLIPSDGRLTLCLSTEVGCNMGCKFCFTALQKLKRRLTAGEIVGQFLEVQKRLEPHQKISNLVYMGMGEPLDNSEEVFRSIDIFQDEMGFNFSRRKITISTSGIVPMIPKVAEARIRLAVSLNGYDDSIRSQLMPINKKYPLSDLLQVCKQYVHETREKVTFEYILISGLTDQVEHARQLHRLTRGIPCKINLLALNEHPGAPQLRRPTDSQIDLFHKTLMDLGAHVLFRRSMGRDILAACGQLTTLQRSENQSNKDQNSRGLSQ